MEKFVISKDELERARIELLFAKQRGADIQESLELVDLLLSRREINLFEFV